MRSRESKEPQFKKSMEFNPEQKALSFTLEEAVRILSYKSEGVDLSEFISKIHSMDTQKLDALISVVDESLPTLDAEKMKKLDGYIEACDTLTRRKQITPEDVVRKVEVLDRAGWFFYAIKKHADVAIRQLFNLGRDYTKYRSVRFREKLADPNSTGGIVENTDRFAKWFIDLYLTPKNDGIRKFLKEGLWDSHLDIRSIAFAFAEELKKRKFDDVESEKMAKQRLAEVIGELTNKWTSRPEPESGGETTVDREQEARYGSLAQREFIPGGGYWEYGRVIRPEDRKFLEDFIRQEGE